EGEPLVHERDRAVADRAGTRVHLRKLRCEEAAARECVLYVLQVVVAEAVDPLVCRGKLQRRRDNEFIEESSRRLERGELQLLLRAEVREETALAHPDDVREPPDREPVESLYGRELGRLAQDRAPAALTVAAKSSLRACRTHSDKLARPFVYSLNTNDRANYRGGRHEAVRHPPTGRVGHRAGACRRRRSLE